MNVIVANTNGADDTWLGMTGITDGVLPPVWPFDKTPVDYIHWDKERLLDYVLSGCFRKFRSCTLRLRACIQGNNYPSKSSGKTNLIAKNNQDGKWRNCMGNNKDYKRSCMCQKPAVPGAPPMPEYPSLPINELCEKDWLYVESANKCIYHDIQERAWDAAQDLCRDKGGDLVSINSPAENLEILQILGSFFIDLTSIGKFRYFGVAFPNIIVKYA